MEKDLVGCEVKKPTFVAEVQEQIEILHTLSHNLLERAACVNAYLYDAKIPTEQKSGDAPRCAMDDFLDKVGTINRNMQAAIEVLNNI
jgi:hypothetical protein